MAQSRAWCFTWNNYDETSETVLAGIECRYLVYGHEVGDESKVPHLQGYCHFGKLMRFNKVKALLPQCHLEPAKGNAEQNFRYCTKQDKDSFVERGERPDEKKGGNAEKQRWEDARASARAGDLDSVPADIYVKYYRTLKEIKKDHMKKPDDLDDLSGVWYWGEAGAGKSRAARADFPDAYFKMCNKWWDGYQGEDAVIIDDVDPNHKVLGHHFKIWSDRYAFLGETKGGAIMIRPKKIVVTSQYSPEGIWDDPETIAAIRRRFTVKHFEKRYAT